MSKLRYRLHGKLAQWHIRACNWHAHRSAPPYDPNSPDWAPLDLTDQEADAFVRAIEEQQ